MPMFGGGPRHRLNAAPETGRVSGTERSKLAASLRERYEAGESVRALTVSTGLPRPLVEQLLTESAVTRKLRSQLEKEKEAFLSEAIEAAHRLREQASGASGVQHPPENDPLPELPVNPAPLTETYVAAFETHDETNAPMLASLSRLQSNRTVPLLRELESPPNLFEAAQDPISGGPVGSRRSPSLKRAFCRGLGGIFDIFGASRLTNTPMIPFEAALADDVHRLYLHERGVTDG